MSKRGGECCDRSKMEDRRREEEPCLLEREVEEDELFPRPVPGSAVAGRAPCGPEARIFALDALAPLFLESIAVFAGFRRDDDRVVTIVAAGERLPPDTKMREEAAGLAVEGLEAGIVP